jgi:hypothetical protein
MSVLLSVVLSTLLLSSTRAQSASAVNAVMAGLGVPNYGFSSCDAIPFSFDV